MNINGMKILSIDSDLDNLAIIQKYAKTLSMEVDSFEDSQLALTASKDYKYDLVIIEYSMPKLNGLDFIRSFRHQYRDTPIIILSDDIEIQEKALRLGGYDSLNKPLSAFVFQARVQNALKLTKALSLVESETLMLENSVNEATKSLIDNEQEALAVIGKIAEYKEHKLNNHSLRMAHSCKLLSKAAGLNEKIQDIAFHASPLYDLGKVGIQDAVLLKPAKLTPNESELVKSHARMGYDVLKYSQSAYLKAAAVISYSHHEKFDGSGYPIGLKGETIPILGRIVALFDVFDALTCERVYKEVWSVEDACQFLIDEKGKHFDPKLVDLFMQNLEEILAIQDKY